MAVAVLMWMPMLLSSTGTPEPASPPATGFLHKTIAFDGTTCAYCVYVPPDYTPDKGWPAILFLHGSGERGVDGFLQTDVGIGRALRRHHQDIPALVIMPQCHPNQGWVGPMGQMAVQCLKKTAEEYRVDPQRVYLTGLSLGGHGAWHLAASMPGTFAAVVPICGFATLDERSADVAREIAPRLTTTPVWCFHGAKDASVPVERSRELVAAVKSAGGTVIEYTEYVDGNHLVWDRVYDDPALWKWLFAQRRAAP